MVRDWEEGRYENWSCSKGTPVSKRPEWSGWITLSISKVKEKRAEKGDGKLMKPYLIALPKIFLELRTM